MGPKILIVRTDRIGDVLLATPVARLLRKQLPNATIGFLVSEYTATLLQENPDIDQVVVDDEGPASTLIDRLRQAKWDCAVVAYPRWRTAWALWRAGIPIRIGPANKLYGLLLTHRIWQHRSRGEKHEADYNLDLLKPLGVAVERIATRLVITPQEIAQAHAMLEVHRRSSHRRLVILHPGSGGSAASWPLRRFIELGDRLQEVGCDVVVTGGPEEDHLYLMHESMRPLPVFNGTGSVSLRQLGALISCADLVVANSSGPLHMAVALGVPTVSIYSSLRTSHPRRWGPYPGYTQGGTLDTVLTPPKSAEPGSSLAAVTVDAVFEACREKLTLVQGSAFPVSSDGLRTS